MSLIDLVDNSKTDKNTIHSYLELYEKILISKKDTAKNILEIGIYAGGSIKLWHDYFINADIYGLDICFEKCDDEIKNKERIMLSCSDAYNDNVFKTHLLNKNIKYDMILDDGPHTLESMIQCIKLYSQLLTTDGILIIEDVQDVSWIEILYNAVPEHLKQFVKVYDLRSNKNRYDDLVFTIDIK
jgi:cephalosporin hydroxylase